MALLRQGKMYNDIESEREYNLSWSEKGLAKEKSRFYTRAELIHQAAIIAQAILENDKREYLEEG